MALRTDNLRWLIRLHGLFVARMMLAATLVPWMQPRFVIASGLLLFSDLFFALLCFALQCPVLTKPAHKRAAGLAGWPAICVAQLMIAAALASSYGHFYILPKG